MDWSAGNRHYRVLRHYPVYQLGTKRIEDLYVIEGAALPCISAPDVKARRLFYYSQKNGLLGFVDLEAVGDAREPSVTMYLSMRLRIRVQ